MDKTDKDNTDKGVIVRHTNQGLRLEPIGNTSWPDIDRLVSAAGSQLISSRLQKLEEVVKNQGKILEQLIKVLKEISIESQTDSPDSAVDIVSE